MAKKKKQPIIARIVKRKDFTENLFCLWLDFDKERKSFSFKPGQYCTIRLADCEDPKNLWRAYSIVSAPHEKFIELFIELAPPTHGNLTPLLHKLKIGDAVSVRPKAKGVFTFDPNYKKHVLIATVTGIASYISMLRDYVHRNLSGHEFFVFHGVSYFDELVYGEELRKLILASAGAKRLAVHYVPTVSRPDEKRNETWRKQTGRVNDILENYLSWFRLNKKNTLVYVCGNPEMIKDAKNRLVPKGWKVKEERYWKE